MPVKVILDSNFLILPSSFRGDIFEELDKIIGQTTEKIVLQPIYDELQRLSSVKSRKTEQQAKLALHLIEHHDVQISDIALKTGESVDGFILRIAQLWNCFVATNDRQLRNQLLEVGVPVVFLRQRTRLSVKGKRF